MDMTIKKKIVYFDMDNVLVDFKSAIPKLDAEMQKKYADKLDEVPGIFSLMTPMQGAVEAVREIAEDYDVYILSTAPWLNPSAWTDKLMWVQKYFGENEGSIFYKRVIISHHKNLCKGDYLIDDRRKNGADNFCGELILFGSEQYPDWGSVVKHLRKESKVKFEEIQ